MHQEREFPGRVSGSGLFNPDFAALARAYGWRADRVDETAGFEAAFRRALDAGTPCLIHLKLDPDVSTSRSTLSSLRATALARQAQR
jgi:acetolactate synthase I/II/III large subunit